MLRRLFSRSSAWAGASLLLPLVVACGQDGRKDAFFDSADGTGDSDGADEASAGSDGGSDSDSSSDGSTDAATTSESTDGEPSCGDGIVNGDEGCDDGVNDGSYGGCNPDCSGPSAYCGDGFVNGPEQCDDANAVATDGCLSSCLVPRSCLEILLDDPQVGDGQYGIGPKGPDFVFSAPCDMSTDGGGWTGLTLPQLCSGNLDVAMTAFEMAPTEGIDDSCRPYTRDGGGDHSYAFDVVFPPGFEAFYLRDFVMKANADGGLGHVSEIYPDNFVQSVWAEGHATMGSATGDVSFGSGSDAGPVISYGALLDANMSCAACETPWLADGQIYEVGSISTLLRLGWGESGGEAEGWYPWWAGSIYVR